MFTSRSLSPHLTIDQANSIFKLVAECQVLNVKLAKEFQVLSGLEAMHHNSIQGTVHETLTLGCSAWEAAYSAILWDKVSKTECEATTHHLCSEADAAWKEIHEVMYNHQLHYNRWLSAFLTDMQGGVSPLCKEVRASRTLSKVLGRVTHQSNECGDHPQSPAASDNSVGSGGPQGSRGGSRSCA